MKKEKESKIVVITRAVEDGASFKSRLEEAGFETHHAPSIRIAKRKLSEEEKDLIRSVAGFDYCIFTSPHAVNFFLDAVDDLEIPEKVLQKLKIAVVGEITAERVRQSGLSICFTPKEFTSLDVLEGLGDVAGKKILLPRSAIAFLDLEKALRAAGAVVSSLDLYITLPIEKADPTLCTLLKEGKVFCITFASSSAVRGFASAYGDDILAPLLVNLPVVCIGPRTAESAEQAGFQNIHIAKSHTTDGIIEAIKQLN